MSSDRERGGQPDLFLLRLWTDEPDGSAVQNDDGQIDEAGGRHGRLLNMLNGEGHNFDSWEELVDMLREMRVPSSNGETASKWVDEPLTEGC